MLIDSHSHVGVRPCTITTTTYIMSRLFCTRLGIHSRTADVKFLAMRTSTSNKCGISLYSVSFLVSHG